MGKIVSARIKESSSGAVFESRGALEFRESAAEIRVRATRSGKLFILPGSVEHPWESPRWRGPWANSLEPRENHQRRRGDVELPNFGLPMPDPVPGLGAS